MRRNSYDIIAEILHRCSDGALKTNAMYDCNISYDQVQFYLKFLTGNGLLRCEDFGKTVSGPKQTRVEYCTTEIGRKYLDQYNEMLKTLKGEEFAQVKPGIELIR